ncbi:hypothetical protein [Pseudomonas sp. EA_65y_Pfl1_P120]|uniref:hypothetical protein n=1 Tax=Pseudomonas sp. EA_65y_Pfl1_P120 TaxID=3088693 RepID=UPI0030D7D9D2
MGRVRALGQGPTLTALSQPLNLFAVLRVVASRIFCTILEHALSLMKLRGRAPLSMASQVAKQELEAAVGVLLARALVQMPSHIAAYGPYSKI